MNSYDTNTNNNVKNKRLIDLIIDSCLLLWWLVSTNGLPVNQASSYPISWAVISHMEYGMPYITNIMQWKYYMSSEDGS